MPKRTLDGFFKVLPVQKKPEDDQLQKSIDSNPPKAAIHPTYPWAVLDLPPYITTELKASAEASGKEIKDQPDLDLLYFQSFIPRSVERKLFEFLRAELFFYRVKYRIQRFGKEVEVNTPRFTSVFGVDETSCFNGDPALVCEGSPAAKPVPKTRYKCTPRPIPECLDILRRLTEAATNTKYNFALVNYYATGDDSISYHSDDERFLGPEPAIASFSLGARRDFLMKHKPTRAKEGEAPIETSPVKFQLASGDMMLMRGPTQHNWLHSVPKRKGPDADKGRINITLRRAIVPGGTENYYQYNVGHGEVYRWSSEKRAMLPWDRSA